MLQNGLSLWTCCAKTPKRLLIRSNRWRGIIYKLQRKEEGERRKECKRKKKRFFSTEQMLIPPWTYMECSYLVYRGRLLIVSQKVNRKYRNKPFLKPLVLEIEFKLKKNILNVVHFNMKIYLQQNCCLFYYYFKNCKI